MYLLRARHNAGRAAEPLPGVRQGLGESLSLSGFDHAVNQVSTGFITHQVVDRRH